MFDFYSHDEPEIKTKDTPPGIYDPIDFMSKACSEKNDKVPNEPIG